MILLNCEHATDRMTDLMEGALPWPKRLALRAHLVLCAGCRAFLKGLRTVPVLAKEAFQEPLPESALGCASLDAALAKIRAGEAAGPRFHPDGALIAQLRAGSADLPMRLLLETHLGACAACRAAQPELAAHAPARESTPPLPAGILAQLPSADAWAWHRHLLHGARSARIWEDSATGVGLWLTFVPKGCCFPHHWHTGHEAAVLLAGWVQDGSDLSGPGDFVQHRGGTGHAPTATSEDGCWILARMGPGGLRFSGWRRIFSS
ncbi:MAG: zf-HC2 domain-containing protein [Acidobacteria bacterium]|nr:zf-HC2 domain-containing protein [Acidobacteriota bacterium]